MEQIFLVLLGGVLAITGGVVGQIIAHQYSRHRDRERTIREKAETAISITYEARDWIDEKRSFLWAMDKDHDSANPTNKVSMLVELYFPECTAQLLEVLKTASPLVDYIYEEKIKKNANKLDWIQNGADERRKKYAELYKAYGTAVAQLQTAIVKNVDRQLATEMPVPSRAARWFRSKS
jgi:hypothetical protein